MSKDIYYGPPSADGTKAVAVPTTVVGALEAQYDPIQQALDHEWLTQAEVEQLIAAAEAEEAARGAGQ